jgi:hypothetical protein
VRHCSTSHHIVRLLSNTQFSVAAPNSIVKTVDAQKQVFGCPNIVSHFMTDVTIQQSNLIQVMSDHSWMFGLKMIGFELYTEIEKIDHHVKVCFITAFVVYYGSLKEIFSVNYVFHKKPIEIQKLAERIIKQLNSNNGLKFSIIKILLANWNIDYFLRS